VEKVEMVCLESEEEMPAWEWEVEEAADEAITIAHRWGPRAVKRSNGGVEGLEVVRVTSVFDSEGRFSPTFDENETKLIEADTIIISIGQMTDTSFLTDGPVKVDERGRVEWDRDTQMSSASGVFVSGEVVTGPGSAIQAAASGHRAAQAIHLYLEGEDVAAGLVEEEKERIGDLPPDVAAKVYRQSREETELRDAATRCRDFTQIEISWDEMTALKEARRCRSCGGGAVVDPDKCMACLTCMRVCPYDAPVVTHTSVISPDRCQACGLCPPECPGRAISMFGYDIDDIRERMPETVGSVEAGRGEPVVVAFMCSKYALDRSGELPENVRPVQVHCASRVDVLDMLKAFECGADGVSVVLCEEGQCRHEGVPKRVVQRVRHVRQLLGEMGRTDCVGYVRTREGLDWRGALVESIGEGCEEGPRLRVQHLCGGLPRGRGQGGPDPGVHDTDAGRGGRVRHGGGEHVRTAPLRAGVLRAGDGEGARV
jgi:NAD-dependent dihydropyrimidine dehydrogenase PreA subunit